MKIISIHSKNIVTLLVILFLGTSFFSCKDFLDVETISSTLPSWILFFKEKNRLNSI